MSRIDPRIAEPDPTDPQGADQPRSVVAVRRAVRSALDALPERVRAAPLLVACSGGADSTALLTAARAVAPGRVHVAVIDHGLQEGSAERSAALVADLVAQGVPAAVHGVVVDGGGGLEAAARRARYGALRTARPHPDSPVLLGHTLDDQAETVLLGLGRGSGARSLAGMRTWDPPWLRPLLGLRRADTAAACRAQGVSFWDDPHNLDPRFTRVRLRREVLPLLEDVLGGGVAEALARTAAQLRDDGEALDAAARDVLARAVAANDDAQLAEQERATRRAGTRNSPSKNAQLAVRRRSTPPCSTPPCSTPPCSTPPCSPSPRPRYAGGPCVPGWVPAASPDSPTCTCVPPTISSAAGAVRVGSRCHGGWSWFASMEGCGCAQRRGRAPDEVRPVLPVGPRRRRRPHEPQEDPPCTTGTSRPY